MSENRDDFTEKTKKAMAQRVCYRCSNPHCRKPTSGPNTDETRTVNVGVAAHIAAAAEGGPRYDPDMTQAQRKDIRNGIWLCWTCSKLIDSDVNRYPVELLHAWKQQAEEEAFRAVEGGSSVGTEDKDVELIMFYVQCMDRPAFKDSLMRQMRMHDRSLVDFEKALSDTCVALATGIQRTREGEILDRAKGKSRVRNPEWNKKLNQIDRILVGIRRKIQIARDPDNPDWYDYNLARELEKERSRAVEIMNSLCREIGINELENGW